VGEGIIEDDRGNFEKLSYEEKKERKAEF
jgi:hypothetical protein